MKKNIIYTILFFLLISPLGAQEKPKPQQEPVSEQTQGVSESEFQQLLDKELGENPAPTEEKKEAPSWGAQILKTAFVLLIMVGIFYLIWKFLVYRREFQSHTSEVMKLLHTHTLSPGKSLQILELGNRLLILGNSDAGLQLITEIHEKPVIDQIKLDCDHDSLKEKPDFWIELSKTIANRIKGAAPTTQSGNDRPWDNIRSRSRSKLDSLKKDRELFNHNDNENL